LRRIISTTIIALSLLAGPVAAMDYVRNPYPGKGAPLMENAVESAWPVSLHRAAKNVAWCESTGKSTAKNGQYVGIFQMGRREWKAYGSGDPYNAYDNAQAAYNLYQDRGWRPWQCQP